MSQTITESDRLEQMAQLRDQRMQESKQKLTRLLRAYPRDAPAELIVFGYGGVKVTLGELKDAFGIE